MPPTPGGVSIGVPVDMPFADLSKFESDPNVQNLAEQLSVRDMCNFVQYKLSKSA